MPDNPYFTDFKITEPAHAQSKKWEVCGLLFGTIWGKIIHDGKDSYDTKDEAENAKGEIIVRYC